MFRKKIAIYVEGQTEQVFINHLILTRWNYTGVKILNIKLQSYQNTRCETQDFLGVDDESTILFLITDVDGVGSLPSAIANRANNQHKTGFEIIALRDLSAQDFNNLPTNIDRIDQLIQTFKKALNTKKCEKPEKIELFFAVMTIDSWLLAFTKAISKWANIPEENILQQFSNKNLEDIKAPSNTLKKIGSTNQKKDPKSFHEICSIVSGIKEAEIESVLKSKRIPNFNKFWDKLISLCDSV